VKFYNETLYEELRAHALATLNETDTPIAKADTILQEGNYTAVLTLVVEAINKTGDSVIYLESVIQSYYELAEEKTEEKTVKYDKLLAKMELLRDKALIC